MWAISETAENKAFLIAVKKKRKELGVKQKQLAYELGMTPSNYSHLENGATELKLKQFIFLCQRLQIQPQEHLN